MCSPNHIFSGSLRLQCTLSLLPQNSEIICIQYIHIFIFITKKSLNKLVVEKKNDNKCKITTLGTIPFASGSNNSQRRLLAAAASSSSSSSNILNTSKLKSFGIIASRLFYSIFFVGTDYHTSRKYLPVICRFFTKLSVFELSKDP